MDGRVGDRSERHERSGVRRATRNLSGQRQDEGCDWSGTWSQGEGTENKDDRRRLRRPRRLRKDEEVGNDKYRSK